MVTLYCIYPANEVCTLYFLKLMGIAPLGNVSHSLRKASSDKSPLVEKEEKFECLVLTVPRSKKEFECLAVSASRSKKNSLNNECLALTVPRSKKNSLNNECLALTVPRSKKESLNNECLALTVPRSKESLHVLH